MTPRVLRSLTFFILFIYYYFFYFYSSQLNQSTVKASIQIVKLGNDTFVLRVCLLIDRTAQKVSKGFPNAISRGT